MERPLLWHQGLFLQPQHFQLADLYTASLLTPLYRHLMPHFWGTAKMDVRQASLGTGTFHLDSGEFVFPDMTYAVVPDNAVVETRSFKDAWIDGGKPFTVYLGIRRFNQLGGNVTTLSTENPAGVNTRFISSEATEEVRDLHENGPTAHLRRLKYALRILWESEKDFFGDYETIPLARLERQGEEVVLSNGFIPPSLAIHGSPWLAKIIREIRDQLASRGYQLEGYKRDRGIHTAEFGSRDMVFLLALRSLNRYIPQLSHMLEATGHPWTAYGLLRQLVGELSSFSERYSVTGEVQGSGGLPLYDHLNLWNCFSRAQAVITSLLDEITAGPEYVFALSYDGTYYSSDLPPAVFEGKNRFYLVVQTASDAKDVLSALATGAKLSSRENLPLLIVRALPGVGITHLDRPPQELPRRVGALYFQVDHHGEQWAGVAKGKNIALFWESAPEDLKAELMVVGRS